MINKKLIFNFILILFVLSTVFFIWLEYKETTIHKEIKVENVKRVNWTYANKLSMYGADQSGIQDIVSWFNNANVIEDSNVSFDTLPVKAKLTINLNKNKSIHLINKNNEILTVIRKDLDHDITYTIYQPNLLQLLKTDE
ncbi:hypothetical protein ACFSCX_23310 [Bacillus salitolerans]|uniref:Uncharacterized protein n=1 Tax=Bacillus salitolerans TaxID=1437434 RepID=A0ABW4LWF2_9BACI